MALAITIVITFCVVVTLVNNHTHIRGLEEDIEYLQRFLLKKGAKEKELLSALKKDSTETKDRADYDIAYLQMQVGNGDGAGPLFHRLMEVEKHLGLGIGEDGRYRVNDLLPTTMRDFKQWMNSDGHWTANDGGS